MPESIAYADFLALIAAAGFDPRHVKELRFDQSGIHAVVFALDENGRRILDPASVREGAEEAGEYQKHSVFIPVRFDTAPMTDPRNPPVSA